MAATEQEAPVSARNVKWRVGERQVPRSHHELLPRRLTPQETHPLALGTTNGTVKPVHQTVGQSPSTSLASAIKQTRPDAESHELVVWHNGDADPLGGHTSWGLAKDADQPCKDKATMTHLDKDISWARPKTTDAQWTAAPVRTQWHHLELPSRLCVHPATNLALAMSLRQLATTVQAMETQLTTHWAQDHKVEALRVAIKCVKLLADTETVPQVYPYAFLRVIHVLDTFGELVFDRLLTRAGEDAPRTEPRTDQCLRAAQHLQATDTCRNWFYKTACIRELVPRIYLEIALLRCYRFVCDGAYAPIAARLAKMINGVGDPLVALYTRWYLASISSNLLSPTETTTVVMRSVFDYLYAFHWYRNDKLDQWLQTRTLDYDACLALHSPAVEGLLQCAAPGATQRTFDTLLSHYQRYSKCTMILHHVCQCFGGRFFASTPRTMLELIRTTGPSQVSKSNLYTLVARQLCTEPTIAEHERGGKWHFLRDAWASITAMDEITPFMACAAAYMQLIVAHFSHRDAVRVLKDTVRHLTAAPLDHVTAKTYTYLGTLLETVLLKAHAVVPSLPFLTLLDMVQHDASGTVAMTVLRAVQRGTSRLAVVGPAAAVAQTLLVVCCRVHDALDSLGPVAARDDAVHGIAAYITRLGYVQRPTGPTRGPYDACEALLTLYTACRQHFFKLQEIPRLLSMLVLRLAMHAQQQRGGTDHDVRPHCPWSGLIHACVAFAHVTIPSLASPLVQLELLTLAATVAFQTTCMVQMDAVLKQAICVCATLHLDALADVDEYPLTTDAPRRSPVARIVHVVTLLINVLVVAPSGYADDAFFYVTALHEAVIERMTWRAMAQSDRFETKLARVRLRLLFVALYAHWGRVRGAGSCATRVTSSLVLYHGDRTFCHDVDVRLSTSIDKVVTAIKALGEDRATAASAAQTECMLDLVNVVVPVLESRTRRTKLERGADLIYQCMRFSYDKVQSLQQSKGQAEAQTTRPQLYFATTRAYVLEFMQAKQTCGTLDTPAGQRLLDGLERLGLD